VAQVASLFARLDGQQQALAGNRFSPALQTRVRLFQREQGLEDDGVVGVQTLLKLNEALGIDLTAAVARDKLAPAGDATVNR
jgi:general secretion pathway protein A